MRHGHTGLRALTPDRVATELPTLIERTRRKTVGGDYWADLE
jgi:hypothetical protein